MFSARIKEFLRFQRLAMASAGMSFGLLVSVFSNWLSEQGIGWLPWVIGVAIVSGAASAVYFFRQSVGIKVSIQSPRTIPTAGEAKPDPRGGVTGFVSPARPPTDRAAAELTPAAPPQAIATRDFDRLQLESSNLWPLIEAILSHQSELEHCWLITTAAGPNTPASAPYALLVEAYLRTRKNLHCKFYHGQIYSIPLDDDALVLTKTYEQVKHILSQAKRLKIAPQELVADITGGLRSMTLGMILACLDREQDVEFIGTRYDENGAPTGNLFPIIFSFEPELG